MNGGSGRCYFNNYVTSSFSKRLSEFGVREQIAILRLEVKLDGTYRVNESGYIDPESYVSFRYVEELFVRARSMEYFLSVSNRNADDKDSVVIFSDTLVLAGLHELLEKKYEAVTCSELSDEIRRKLVREIRKQFNAPPKQLARVFNCPLSDIVNSLNE